MVYYGLCLLLFISCYRVILADTCYTEVITKPGYIVNMQASTQNGAELLGGVWSVNATQCLSQCCEQDECDLALYRSEGRLSDKGHNCYLIACRLPANCVLADHNQFTSFMLDRRVDGSYVEEEANAIVDDTNTDETHTSGREHSITDASDSSHPVPIRVDPTPAMDHTNSTKDTSTSSLIHTPTSNSTAELPHDATTTNISTSHKDPSTTSNATPIADLHGLDEVAVDKGCGSSKSCHGDGNQAGLIAVGALGGVAFIAVILVSIVAIKRILDSRRRKQFRNVDYLINGMYS